MFSDGTEPVFETRLNLSSIIIKNIITHSVFEIVLGELVDSQSINERTFGGLALLLVDQINMQ